MSVTPALERIGFPDPYQYAVVPAGETKIVWEMPVSAGYVAFINQIACDWFASCFWDFICDGVHRKIEHEFPVTEPNHFDPPIVARKRIKWIFHNEGAVDRTVGVLCDGELVRTKMIQ